MSKLEFRPIDLHLHSDLCLKFRTDSFIESFGTPKPFYEDDGKGGERYLAWLKSQNPDRYGIFHIWLGGDIIGQLELGERNSQDGFGYVNLYYLAPEWRGRGYSDALDKFAMNFLRGLGFKKARLSVSPTNLRAIGFYKKNGWLDKGERRETQLSQTLKFSLHFLEKEIC